MLISYFGYEKARITRAILIVLDDWQITTAAT
nr:MAG TPA: hypothetical protein [Caudoviricetes sp.]